MNGLDVATISTNTRAVAGSPYAITAVYSGDTTHLGSTSNVGSQTITPAPLVITADNATKTYGQTVTFAGTAFTESGLVNTDTVTSVTLTSSGTAATATVAGSPYAITPSAAVGSGLGNYTITYDAGKLTVNAAALTITANNATKTYGQTVAFAGTAFTESGLVNTDTVTSVTLTSSGAAATATVAGSPYTITPSAAVGIGLGNYTITYDAGKLTVNTAPLTITANNATKTYGQTVAFAGTAFTESGLVNTDTVTSVTLTSSGTAAAATVAGSPYAIVPSAAVGSGLGNYTITYKNGTLTVNKDATTTTATTSIPSGSMGQTVTITATVTAKAPGSGTPTGSVDFFDTTTGDDLGTLNLSSGVATLNTASLPPGANVITLSYSGDSNFLSSTTSAATIVISQSIIVLDPTASGALDLSGNASIKVAGGVYVDSSSASALEASGNAQISATAIDVHGGVQKSGNASFNPAVVTKAGIVSDPLAGLPVPATSGVTNYGGESLSGNSKATIKPGIYSSIAVSGNAVLTMDAGLYIIEGGGFQVSGNASVTGAGVTLYNAGSKFPNSGGSFGAISLSGNGTVELSPSATGAYAGVLIIQPAANTQALAFSGNAMAGVTGTVYAPGTELVESGNAQVSTSIVVDSMSLSGNAEVNRVTSSGE